MNAGRRKEAEDIKNHSFITRHRETVVFMLLVVCLTIYIVVGGGIFLAVERPAHDEAINEANLKIQDFIKSFNVTTENVTRLLQIYDEFASKGVSSGDLFAAPKHVWTFGNSIYFSGTIVSTIGYGSLTPITVAGKFLVIVYGLLGCSMCVLFFNLFMERFISCLSYFMGWYKTKRLKRIVRKIGNGSNEVDMRAKKFRPPASHVLLGFFIFGAFLALILSMMYTLIEKWSFSTSVYSSFVSFSTIGFGDYQGTQKIFYSNINKDLYVFLSGFLIAFGCCSCYAIFNLIATFINRLLHYVVSKIPTQCNETKKENIEENERTVATIQPVNGEGGARSSQEATEHLSTRGRLLRTNFNATYSHGCRDQNIIYRDEIRSKSVNCLGKGRNNLSTNNEIEFTWLQENCVGPMSVLAKNIDC